MERNSLLIFLGLLLVAASIFVHADNSRYVFYVPGGMGYAKLDTRTGDGWLCGVSLDTCMPVTNKAAFKQWTEKQNPQP
jgi:hypothetical protein